ncbi:MAG: hypothetical protein U0326_07035 [Polyangiales bacterium]
MEAPSEQLRTIVAVAAMGARATARRVAGVSVLAGWFLSVALLALSPTAATLVSVAAMVTALGAMVAGLVRAQTTTTRCDILCRRDGLTIRADEGLIELPREALAEGIVRSSQFSWQLRLTARDGRRYDIDTPDEATARRWLTALGLDASGRAARVTTNRPLLQGVFAYFLGGFFASPIMALTMLLTTLLAREEHVGAGIAIAYLATLPAYWLAARSVGHVDITVGADGIYAGRGWFRTFIPIYGVHSASVLPSQVETLALRLHSGEVKTYRLETAGDANAVAQRIRDVQALHLSGLPDALQRALSAQTEDTPEAWRGVFVDAVRGGTYRDVALTLDDVTRVLSAPMVRPAQRLGAAMALRELDAGDAPTRVRVAVEMVADPSMQRALEASSQPAARETASATKTR